MGLKLVKIGQRFHVTLSEKAIEILDLIMKRSGFRSRSRAIEEIILSINDLANIYFSLQRDIREQKDPYMTIGAYMKTMQIPLMRVGLLLSKDEWSLVEKRKTAT